VSAFLGSQGESNKTRARLLPRTYVTMSTVRVILTLMWLFAGVTAWAADLPAGQIIDRVACAADPSQSYALFVPAD